jgi:hypothetical protein
MPKVILFNFLLCLSLQSAVAQNLELKQIQYLNNKVVLTSELTDSIEGRYYSVRVYSSADGFLNALEKVSGDVGLQLKSGKNKTITWSAAEELGNGFEGKIALELRARLFVPFISTESINAYKEFKRKRTYHLTWSGGTPQNILNFDLMKGTKKVISFPNVANVGHHAFEFPAYIKPAKNYHFRISDSKNKDEQVVTTPFRIKRKVPLVIKAIPVVAFVAVMYLVIAKDKNMGESEIEMPITPH